MNIFERIMFVTGIITWSAIVIDAVWALTIYVQQRKEDKSNVQR